jgi:flavorubredoxin
MVNKFLNWIETLPCGVDLMTPDHYRAPQAVHIRAV